MDDYTYELELNNGICEAVECFARATEKIEVKVGNERVISLLLCTNCISKFDETSA